jgi:hypothetical protein
MGKVRFNRLSRPSRQWGITCGPVPRRCQGGATKGTEDAKSNKAAEEKMKLGKVENRETEIRIDQYILAREKRETTRKKIRT